MAHKGLPHNAILNYDSDAFSPTGWTSAGKCNLARDYSMLNRQHWQQTTSKGVPLVYRVALTFSPLLTAVDDDGVGATVDIFQQDEKQVQVIAIKTAQQNWVQRNGCVKTHFARENMFKVQGIKKSDRGAYDKTMHIAWTAGVDTFLTPQDGDRSDYTAGSWEYSKLIFPDDANGAYLNVIGTHGDEESTTAFSTLSIPQLYLSSRKQVDDDTNTDDDDQPKLYSVINKLFALGGHAATQDEVIDLARDNQDEPPYDLAENGNDCEPIEAARVFLGITSGVQQTVVVDVPYGLFEIQGVNANTDDGDNSRTNGVSIRTEVIDIFPMGEG